jgi:hypothetical protein
MAVAFWVSPKVSFNASLRVGTLYTADLGANLGLFLKTADFYAI